MDDDRDDGEGGGAVGDGAADGAPFEPRVFGHGGEHGLAREMLCSLPRPVACRVCRGEADCPWIESRSATRVVVRRRVAAGVLGVPVRHALTGAHDEVPTPWWQVVGTAAAWVGWLVALVVSWSRSPAWVLAACVAVVAVASVAASVVGVPLARARWADHGGTRRGGAWRRGQEAPGAVGSGIGGLADGPSAGGLAAGGLAAGGATSEGAGGGDGGGAARDGGSSNVGDAGCEGGGR